MEDACAERREADIKALEKSIERENLGLMDGFAKPRKKEIAKLVKTLEEMRKEDKMKRTNTSNEFNVRKSGFFEWKSGGP